MPLTPGSRLGGYEIVAAIGAGGMGEVFRARDMKLKRDVAVKILASSVAADPDRLARFQREAEVLASLNHPHIGAIYGVEHADGVMALVMELVEGEDLAQRIARGPIPIDEALPIADQIAQALEAAHEQGIVHRDLKPANIKVRPGGTVKVLDFGLAKALDPPAGTEAAGNFANSPTITTPAMTARGVILGTAAYMSPEQARGHAVDKSTDIWAFGCVLFEMLTGARAFAGSETADVIASLLRAEPDWSLLPAETPEPIRRTLRRCLAKDRKRRLADIRDARLEIEEALGGVPERVAVLPRETRTRERVLWAVALALVAAGAAAIAWRGRSVAVTPLAEMRVEITTPPTSDPVSVAISPDGQHIAFVASADGRPQLWLRTFATGATRSLRGTEGASFPFWSPDNKSIGFFTNERLYRTDVDGGVPKALAFAAVGTGGSWNRDGVILFTPVPDAPIVRVSAEGGQPVPVPPGDRGLGQRFPHFLPDGRHFLYFVRETRGVFLGDLDGGPRRRLVDADAAAVFAPPGEVLFVRGGTLYAQDFDFDQLQLTGELRTLADGVAVDGRGGGAALSASGAGSVLYRIGLGSQRRNLVWLDRGGKELATIGEPDPGWPINLALSPDGTRAAMNRTIEGNTDIWLIDLTRGVRSRFTSDPVAEIVPIWAPDGSRILFAKLSLGVGAFGLYQRGIAQSGPDSLFFQTAEAGIPDDWSRDGRYVLFRLRGDSNGWDILAKAVTGDAEPIPVARTAFEERTAQFSPDGAWVAYESDESGRFEIYVQAFPRAGAKSAVSTAGGSQVRWRADGREIFYVASDGRLMAVPVGLPSPGGNINLGAPTPLFRTRVESTVQGGIAHTYDVAPDGQRFLMSTFIEQTGSPLTLILNRASKPAP